jgi:hypothetical protein
MPSQSFELLVFSKNHFYTVHFFNLPFLGRMAASGRSLPIVLDGELRSATSAAAVPKRMLALSGAAVNSSSLALVPRL